MVWRDRTDATRSSRSRSCSCSIAGQPLLGKETFLCSLIKLRTHLRGRRLKLHAEARKLLSPIRATLKLARQARSESIGSLVKHDGFFKLARMTRNIKTRVRPRPVLVHASLIVQRESHVAVFAASTV
jgi:hypothetical protein